MSDKRRIWRCEKDHLDDFHLSIEGAPERCSRCGGSTEEYVPATALEAAEARAEKAERFIQGIAEEGAHGVAAASAAFADHARQVRRADKAEARAEQLQEERNRWIRLFNRLDAAVSRHCKAKDPEGHDFVSWSDDTDEALHAAHDRILKSAAEKARV